MRKLLVTSILVLCNVIIYAQAPDTKFNFGFNVGANYSFLRPKEPMTSNSQIYNGIGAKVGLLMDYSISNKLIFAPKTELAINKSEIQTYYNPNASYTYKIFPISLEIMAHFVYKIDIMRTTHYILAGPNIRLPLKFSAKTSTDFTTKPDLAIDFGIGMEDGLKNFIFSPEIRFSFGLFNVNNNPLFQTLYYHNISLVLNFK